MNLQDAPAYRKGFKHGKQGHYYDPPLSNYGHAEYLAGWNTARNSDLFACMSDEQRRIIKSQL